MDWMILVPLVPLVVLPIVLLLGFCGCSEFGADTSSSVTTPATAPANLHAVLSASGDGIVLSWLSTDSDTLEFVVERRREDAAPGEPAATFVASPNVLVDPIGSGLLEGTTYVYTVLTKRFDLSLSGPSNAARCTMPPAPPIAPVATAADLDRIDLKWTNASTRANRFKVLHRAPGGAFAEIAVVNGTTFSHLGLLEGSAHEYQIVAIVSGFDDSNPKDVLSGASVATSGTTLSWKTCFASPLTPPVALGLAGFCVVQRINAASLTQSGQFARVTLRGLPAAVTRLSAVTISSAVPVAQVQAWDSLTPPLSLTFGGSPSVTLQNGQPATSDKVKFKITAGSLPDLAIAFNVAANSQNLLSAAANGLRYYSKAAAAEATAQDRSALYTPTPNQVVCIEKIEVA